MTRYSPEEIAAGARALTDHIYGPETWQKCAPEVQQINCQAFTAGVATLPDHTAALLGALEQIAKAAGKGQSKEQYTPSEYLLIAIGETARTAIANVRTQTKGAVT